MQTNLMTGNTIMTGSRQWANRPDDERYLDLDTLREAVASRKQQSWTSTPRLSNLRVIPTEDNGLQLQTYDRVRNAPAMLDFTNWSFGQLCSQYAGAPASYLRKLPAELAAINLQWGLEANNQREDGLLLATGGNAIIDGSTGQIDSTGTLRAATSTTYGRIWDLQVVDAVIRANRDNRWHVPAASYATQNPKRATTLYASDRDVFLFMVDPANPIDVGGDTLFRGFMVWNSETGAASFGLTTFLYRYICDNRIVWGATNVQELRIRHTSGAPDRFSYEGARYLQRYAEESTVQTVRAIEAARDMEIPIKASTKEENEESQISKWLQNRGFTASEAKASVTAAKVEEGECRSVWDIVNGITAYARTQQHTDNRVNLETRAGKLMEMAAEKAR